MNEEQFSPSEMLIDFNKLLSTLCCDTLTFMWKNSLLSPRDQWFAAGRTKSGAVAYMRFICGFRVRRKYIFLRRDQVLYRCPFCANELIIPIGYTDHDGVWMNPPVALGMGVPAFEFKKTFLEEALADTKRRCRGIWPPTD